MIVLLESSDTNFKRFFKCREFYSKVVYIYKSIYIYTQTHTHCPDMPCLHSNYGVFTA